MDLGGFVVAEFLGYVAGYSPVGVLVDGCWDERGDVFACEFFVDEAWRGLDGWPHDPADVGAVLEAEAAARRAVRDAFSNFQGDVVEQVDVFCVVDDEGVFRFEAERDEVQRVFVGVFAGFFEAGVVVD